MYDPGRSNSPMAHATIQPLPAAVLPFSQPQYGSSNFGLEARQTSNTAPPFIFNAPIPSPHPIGQQPPQLPAFPINSLVTTGGASFPSQLSPLSRARQMQPLSGGMLPPVQGLEDLTVERCRQWASTQYSEHQQAWQDEKLAIEWDSDVAPPPELADVGLGHRPKRRRVEELPDNLRLPQLPTPQAQIQYTPSAPATAPYAISETATTSNTAQQLQTQLDASQRGAQRTMLTLNMNDFSPEFANHHPINISSPSHEVNSTNKFPVTPEHEPLSASPPLSSHVPNTHQLVSPSSPNSSNAASVLAIPQATSILNDISYLIKFIQQRKDEILRHPLRHSPVTLNGDDYSRFVTAAMPSDLLVEAYTIVQSFVHKLQVSASPPSPNSAAPLRSAAVSASPPRPAGVDADIAAAAAVANRQLMNALVSDAEVLCDITPPSERRFVTVRLARNRRAGRIFIWKVGDRRTLEGLAAAAREPLTAETAAKQHEAVTAALQTIAGINAESNLWKPLPPGAAAAFVVATGDTAFAETPNEPRIGDYALLLRLLAAGQSEHAVHLVYEFPEGGALFEHWLRPMPQGRVDSEDTARFYSALLVMALQYLHYAGIEIAHRGISPDAMFLDSKGYLKLAGFANSVSFAGRGRKCTERAPPRLRDVVSYTAPEILAPPNTHGVAADWWSVGCVVFEMIAGRRLFVPPPGAPSVDENSYPLVSLILTADLRIDAEIAAIPPLPNGVPVSAECRDFLRKLLVADPNRRLGGGPSDAAEVMAHPWFAGVDWAKLARREVNAPCVPAVEFDGDIDAALWWVQPLQQTDKAASSGGPA